MTYYETTWDSRVWGWTLVVGALLLWVLWGLLKSSVLATPMRFGSQGVAATILVGLLLITFSFSPRGYEVKDGVLAVKTFARAFRFDLRNVVAVERASSAEVFGGGVRTFGVGGLFGYYGYFNSPKLGKFLAFATARERLVVIRLADRVIVVSPNRPDEFVANLKAAHT
jgi:hypothetical protein